MSAPATQDVAVLIGAPTGIAGQLTFRVTTLAGVTVGAEETSFGIREGELGVYSISYVRPAVDGTYLRVWRHGDVEAPDPFTVGDDEDAAAIDTRTVERGDSYTGARALAVTDPSWPDLTGATVRYVAPMGTRSIDAVCTVTPPRAIVLEQTADETAAMAPALYEGELQATLADGSSVTLARLNLDARNEF